MRITERQLRRIIKEEKARLLHEDIGGISLALIDDYNSWVHKEGHVTPASSSVMASYLITSQMEEDLNALEMMSDHFKIDRYDVLRDIKRQTSEASPQMVNPQYEGTSLDDMPDSWRQVLGNCLKGKK